MSDKHTALIGKSDAELLGLAPEATHQHFKGGLYRLMGRLRDADHGGWVYGKDGLPRISYLHVYPYEAQAWVRDLSEAHGDKDGQPRFRELRR
jgi:hypothetical protein